MYLFKLVKYIYIMPKSCDYISLFIYLHVKYCNKCSIWEYVFIENRHMYFFTYM